MEPCCKHEVSSLSKILVLFENMSVRDNRHVPVSRQTLGISWRHVHKHLSLVVQMKTPPFHARYPYFFAS